MSRPFLLRIVVALAAGLVALAIADNARPWRRLQVEFLELERQQLEGQLAAARARAEEGAAGKRAEEIRQAVADERDKLRDRRQEIEELENELESFRAKLGQADRRRRALRRARDEARYRGPRVGGEAETAALDSEILETRIEIEGIQEFVDDREERLRRFRSGLAAAEERRAGHYAEVEDIEARLSALERGSSFRRLPVAGLFHPAVAIRQASPAGGGDPAAVDRCGTCHLGAHRRGFEGERWPQPFRSHPRLDLFLGDGSPHPSERFGCTPCHGGDGRATDFRRAGHRPAAAGHSAPILPLPLVESTCARCHGGEGWIAEAPTWNAGLELVREMGCEGCHDLGPLVAGGLPGDLPRPGPSLAGIAGKTRPAWVFHWLTAPRDFRPTTWMPHLFPPAQDEVTVAEIRSVVTYLWERSRPQRRETSAGRVPEGDAGAGRALFESLGCTGCHLLDPGAVRGRFEPGSGRLHGPNLARTGSKVGAAWLFAWLRDPRTYRADTPMPDLRLSEREAADLTAYLMAQRDPGWEDRELPAMPAAARDRRVLADLRQTDTIEGSLARLEEMSERQRDVYLGERTIDRYGCPGCHQIPGFEDPDGGGLPAIGRPRRTFDLAAAASFHPRPRAASGVFPDYGMSPREAEAVAVVLLGAGGPRAASPLAAGRALVSRYGCRGCHRVESSGPGGSLAPGLTLEGARVRSTWLFSYLRDPAAHRVRPWLAARMPAFHLGDGELDALVRFFAERDGRNLLIGDPPPPGDVDLAVGRAVYAMLQCGRCHRDAEETGGLEVLDFAPAYAGVHRRLRPRWVVDWILDPRRFDPQTTMPASFPPAADGRPDSSFLAGNVMTPMFRPERDRLRRRFASDDELGAYLSDPVRVAEALRAYLWSLGE